jgi:hypothetical protein
VRQPAMASLHAEHSNQRAGAGMAWVRAGSGVHSRVRLHNDDLWKRSLRSSHLDFVMSSASRLRERPLSECHWHLQGCGDPDGASLAPRARITRSDGDNSGRLRAPDLLGTVHELDASEGKPPMSDTVDFTIGAEVSCEDGVCGELRRVVVNPIKHAITHLVVEPKFHQNMGHLVPIDLVETTTAKEIRLRCTLTQFEGLEDAEETNFLPGASGQWGYQQNQMLSMPFFGLLGMGGMGMGMGGLGMGGMGMRLGGLGLGGMGMGGMGMGGGPRTITSDKVPEGEVEIRRGQPVNASDGPIGRIHGFVVNPSDHQLTHVLLDEGHLWGKKEVCVPISSVTGIDDDGVHLSLSKKEVGDLPPIDIEHPT